ncbi:hypothetical protein C6P43_002346, partial [Kluyveromyces marxianus]
MDWSILLFAVFLFSGINATSENTDSGTILGCDPKQSTNNQGFDITYYGYPMVDRNGKGQCFTYDTSYKESWYQQGGYQTYGSGEIGSSHGVNDLTFRYAPPSGCSRPVKGTLPSNFNYDTPITLTNFSMLITGYFYASKTGEYQFILNYIDDLSFLNIGAGRAFDCCEQRASVANPGPFDLSVTWPQTDNTATVTLLGGYYYPIRIFFVNRLGPAGLTVSFKDPDGVLHSTFDGYIYSIPDGQPCPVPVVTTTLPWTGTVTTTFTTLTTITGQNGGTSPGNLVVVETPEVQTATTVFTPWTGTTTATIATDLTTTTGADGVPTVKTIYHVETPEVQTATTVFTPWTGVSTVTIATDLTTTTGADGVETVLTTYLVETPGTGSATTVNTPWTGTFTSTYSTEIVSTTGIDGVETVLTTYLVETPGTGSASTINTPWTGTFTSTYSTEIVSTTGIDG